MMRVGLGGPAPDLRQYRPGDRAGDWPPLRLSMPKPAPEAPGRSYPPTPGEIGSLRELEAFGFEAFSLECREEAARAMHEAHPTWEIRSPLGLLFEALDLSPWKFAARLADHPLGVMNHSTVLRWVQGKCQPSRPRAEQVAEIISRCISERVGVDVKIPVRLIFAESLLQNRKAQIIAKKR